MQRRTFFKSIVLATAALTTGKLTRIEAAEAAEIPTPKAVYGTRAYVTTVKGPTATIQHGLGKACVFVIANNLEGHPRFPHVEPVDRNCVKLTFAEPWSITGRRKVYKVVVSC